MKGKLSFLVIAILFLNLLFTSCTSEKEKIIPGNLQFFETYVYNDIASQWSQAVTLSKQMYDPKSTQTAQSTNLKGLGELVNSSANDFAVGSVKVADKSKVDELLKRTDILDLFPDDLKFMWSAEPEKMDYKSKEMGYRLYACKVPQSGKADVGGKDILKASTGYDSQNGDITVDLQMTIEGADKWAKMTAENVGKFIAITMDDVVYSAPRVNQAINGGNTQISGNFSIEEAKKLCDRINSNAPIK